MSCAKDGRKEVLITNVFFAHTIIALIFLRALSIRFQLSFYILSTTSKIAKNILKNVIFKILKAFFCENIPLSNFLEGRCNVLSLRSLLVE